MEMIYVLSVMKRGNSMFGSVTAMGLGHVDAATVGAQGPGVHRTRRVTHVPLRLEGNQHEYVLPGALL